MTRNLSWSRAGSKNAKVAKLADAPDLGSGAGNPWGFKSPLSHHTFSIAAGWSPAGTRRLRSWL